MFVYCTVLKNEGGDAYSGKLRCMNALAVKADFKFLSTQKFRFLRGNVMDAIA
jgi:hypothetical protein